MTLRLGIALNYKYSGRVRDFYEQTIDTIVAAERVGLDGAWVAQHHFDNTEGPIPSPLVLLAAAARHTERIALGTGITTLPVEDPIRLAEDAAVLDVLAGGRLHLGLGTGGANLDGFAAFGLHPGDRHAVFDRKVRRLHQVLDGGPLVDRGDGPRLFPPAAGVRGRLWQAVTSVDGAIAAARAGDGIQQGAFFDPPDTGQRPRIEAYLEEWRRIGHAAPPRVAVFRFVYPGRSKDDVVREIEPVLGPKLAAMGERAALSGNDRLRGLDVRGWLDLAPVYGTAADIAEQLAADPAFELATDLVANFSYREDFDASRAGDRLTFLAQELGPLLARQLNLR